MCFIMRGLNVIYRRVLSLRYHTSRLISKASAGEIKSEPSHFKVEEIPLYEPEGKGDHVYLRVSREGRNTRDLVLALSDSFGLKESDIGCAGQKDKHAVAIQTFSVYLPHADDAKVLEQARRDLPGEVLWAKRHVNKLKNRSTC